MSERVEPDRSVEEAVTEAVLGDAAPAAPADFLALVERSAAATRATNTLLHQAVDSARAAGHSWAAIGRVLDMCRQAAQQRFGAAPPSVSANDDDDERWLGPLTAFDEMGELELAGQLGWRTVEAGFLHHRMVRTATQWEHRRILARGTARFERDGWQVGCRAFPWVYLVRDTGRPVEPKAPERIG